MDLPVPLQRALQRLHAALDALDAAAERSAEAGAARAEAERHAMRDDRARLAGELEGALARARTLDRAAEEVAGRLDRAGATVRGILAELRANDTSPGPA